MGLVGHFECNSYIVNCYIHGHQYSKSPVVSPSNGLESPSMGRAILFTIIRKKTFCWAKTLLTAHEVA